MSSQKREVVSVVHNDDRTSTVLYFGRTVGFISHVAIKGDRLDRAEWRAVTVDGDLRFFPERQEAINFLIEWYR